MAPVGQVCNLPLAVCQASRLIGRLQTCPTREFYRPVRPIHLPLKAAGPDLLSPAARARYYLREASLGTGEVARYGRYHPQNRTPWNQSRKRP